MNRAGMPVAALLLGVAVVVVAGPVGAQQQPTQDSVPQRPPGVADTVAVDSTRIRILDRLRALGRGPGLDTARLAEDSLAAEQEGPAGVTARPAGGASVGAQDSVAAGLRALQGYAITEYSGTSAEFESADRTLVLRGTEEERPEVSRAGSVLRADSAIVYDETTGRVRARGDAEYTPETGDPVESRTMVLDLETQRGSAIGARTRYDQGGTQWYVSGDLPSVESELVYGSQTHFTSCDLEEPHYHFEAGQIKIHQGNMLVARPVRLYFADVPVAWLPFIAQSLAQGRASGLLTPRFSVNDIVRTSGGYNRRISNLGFYWAMSDYSDATLALDWFSDQFTAVTVSARYVWARQFLNGNVSIRQFWGTTGRELAFDTRHSWTISERTRFSMDASFATSSRFVRENSFDPREVTQSIRSQGGFNHRFDWGSLNVSANRQQYLTDDRVEMTLPDAALSINPITFFRASPAEAGLFNNITWNGSASVSRRIRDFGDQALDTAFDASLVDEANTSARASSGLSVGNFSFSQSGSYSEDLERDVPDFVLDPDLPMEPTADVADLSRENVSWNAGLSYQQRLIGSTTLTPRVQISGRAVRSDTLSLASGFVWAPMRPSVGARLKTDAYGFYPGVGSFESIRHKISPGISYDYSPQVTPTPLQRDVFGSGEIQTRSVLSLSLNQTFEAKLTAEAEAAAAEEEAREEAVRDSLAAVAADSAALAGDTVAVEPEPEPDELLADDGLRRLETGRAIALLGLQTSVLTYDFIRADTAGEFLGGFQTTMLRNTVRSDYLGNISVQISHDLFREETLGVGEEPGPPGSGRIFDPHLSAMNFGFSLDSSSPLFEWLGMSGATDGAVVPRAEELEDEDTDLLGSSLEGTDESSIVPGQQDDEDDIRAAAGVGEWSANFTYALQRPRDPERVGNQMLSMNFRFQPTINWQVNWSTSYDLNRGHFNDHRISLSRDLHRWRADFGFLQTATGNWSFRFQVSLLDNRDLQFDYQQRSNLD